MKITKRSFFVLIVLIAGFAGGLIVASNLEWTPAIIGRDQPESVSKSTTPSSARAGGSIERSLRKRLGQG
jgi:hypothetical protein